MILYPLGYPGEQLRHMNSQKIFLLTPNNRCITSSTEIPFCTCLLDAFLNLLFNSPCRQIESSLLRCFCSRGRFDRPWFEGVMCLTLRLVLRRMILVHSPPLRNEGVALECRQIKVRFCNGLKYCIILVKTWPMLSPSLQICKKKDRSASKLWSDDGFDLFKHNDVKNLR